MFKKAAVLIAVLVAVPAFAAGVDGRAATLQGRIDEGVATGQLNGAEAARLQARENHVERTIARSRARGGTLNLRERAHINRIENRVSRAVYRDKH